MKCTLDCLKYSYLFTIVSTTVATEVAGSSTKASSSTKEDTLTTEPTTETSTEDLKTGKADLPLNIAHQSTQQTNTDIDEI